MLFFPGLKGDKGDKGDAGPASTVPGPAGAAGAVAVYPKVYSPLATYYDTAFRKDIVAYNGRYWITNNPAKSGQVGWAAPTVDDWSDFGATLVTFATALDLQQATNIAVGLNIQSPGYAKSDNFVQFLSGWLLAGTGRAEFYDALLSGWISTNTPKFNLEDVNRAMPGVASAEFNIPAIVDGDIPVNPTINNVTDDALIFFGWNQGVNTFLENRFGNETQKFDVFLSGIGQNDSAGVDLFYIQVYYRTRVNGGAWDPWIVIPQDEYMNKLAGEDQSFQLVRPLTVALTGDTDIQFSAGFSKGAAGVASISGAIISVRAYN